MNACNRPLFGNGIFVAEFLHIEKLDKKSRSTNFHNNIAANFSDEESCTQTNDKLLN
ncbi:protein of unknown function [Methylotuvimicrobium alcaliphilum 20Z]|uniref:Uncharacterized protein n=1 Tax=Methylotuvimicrobium alcaliphilum (strain DSM 19304 / NCIMB 14124 / VKM B-2133 / 20Z) TaxID=1091494 RepID=G4SZW8_META2|nr:protein of unknown function [Methylotuvimicrobium alcaliphilum 20Z]